jgi:hypothetical protein
MSLSAQQQKIKYQTYQNSNQKQKLLDQQKQIQEQQQQILKLMSS